MSVPKDTPEDLLENKAGAFVSLHKGSNLRGCIDTFLPMQFNEASEIIQTPSQQLHGTRVSIH